MYGLLLVTASSVIYTISTFSVFKTGILTGIRSTFSAQVILTIWLPLLIIRQGFVLTGVVHMESSGEVVPNLVGRKWDDYSSNNPIAPHTLILVTQFGCGACENASRELTTLKVNWKKVPACTVAEPDKCFNGAGISFPTPMILAVNEQGVITFQSNGWPEPGEERNALLHQVGVIPVINTPTSRKDSE